MSAMKNLRELLTKNNIDAAGFSIEATVTLQKAYSKGDFDFFEPEVTAIQLSNGLVTQVIELSSAYDEVARAVHNSGKVSFSTQSWPRGADVPMPVEHIVIPLDLTMRRAEADWELQDALHDDTEGCEQRFEDARWKVFTLTDVFAQTPCSREVFDDLSLEKNRLLYRGTFSEFYADWNNADKSIVVNGEIKPSVRALVEKTAESFLELDETGDEVKAAIYGSFKVHPLHRPLFDAVVDDIVTSRNPSLSC
jgi:hypothetical protein